MYEKRYFVYPFFYHTIPGRGILKVLIKRKSYGCRQVDEYADEAGGITNVYAISRAEWEWLFIPDAPENE